MLYRRRIWRQFHQLTQSIDEKLDVLLVRRSLTPRLDFVMLTSTQLDGLTMNSERIQALGRVNAVRVVSRRDDGVSDESESSTTCGRLMQIADP